MTTESLDNRAPSTLQKLITLRIEQLGDDSRQVLHCAAIIGARFEYKLLKGVVGPNSTVLDKCLKQLDRYDLIYEKSKFPQKIFHFRHPGIRQLIYNRIQPKKRMSLHTMVGLHLEHSCTNNIDENIHNLSYHFLNSDRSDKALEYALKYGEQLLKTYKLKDALNFFIRAYDLVDDLDDPAQKIKLKKKILKAKWQIYHHIGNYDLAVLCLDILKSIVGEGNVKESMEIKNMLAQIYMERGEFKRARTLISENIAYCRANTVKDLLLASKCLLANICVYREDAQTTEEICEEALKLCTGKNSKEKGMLFMFRAFACAFRNEHEKALDLFLKAMKVFESIEEKHFIGRTYCNIGMMHFKMGNYLKAQENYEKSYEILKEIEIKKAMAITRMNLAVLYDHLGNYRTALKEYNAVLKESEGIGNTRLLMMVFCNMGEVFTRIGKLRIAQKYLRESIEMSKQLGSIFWELSGTLYLGICNFESGNEQEARINLLEAIDLCRNVKDKGKEFEARIELLKVKYCSENTLKEANELYEEIQQTGRMGVSESINEKILLILGLSEMKYGNQNMARKYLEMGYSCASDRGECELQFLFLSVLAGHYDKLGNKKPAREYLKKAMEQYDENFSKIPSSSHKSYRRKRDIIEFLNLLKRYSLSEKIYKEEAQL